jgi:hypothetical protein
MAYTYYHRGKIILLYVDCDENNLLNRALKFLPDLDFGNVAIITTSTRFGLVLSDELRNDFNVVLLSDTIFPQHYSPTDKIFRFLVFTVLHEFAHIAGKQSEPEADSQAIEWFNQKCESMQDQITEFTTKEKEDTESTLKARNWIYISQKGDANQHLTATIGLDNVQAFLEKCEREGNSVSRVVRLLVEEYNEGSTGR